MWSQYISGPVLHTASESGTAFVKLVARVFLAYPYQLQLESKCMQLQYEQRCYMYRSLQALVGLVFAGSAQFADFAAASLGSHTFH